METKTLSAAQIELLNKPLPPEAVSPHPTKKFLSSIKSIYVTERLNEVFGVGRWSIKSEIVENADKMIVVKAFFSVPEYGIEYESYGGNDNADRGDAYKGATTDALTKIGSWLGIGADVFKDKATASTSRPASQPQQSHQPHKKTITEADFEDNAKCDSIMKWLYGKYKIAENKDAFNAGACLSRFYNISADNMARANEVFKFYLKENNL